MDMMRGTNKPFRFRLFPHGGQTALDTSDVSDVEVTVGSQIRKTYSDGGIIYDNLTDPEAPRWQFALNQRDTYSLAAGNYPLRVRVKYIGSDAWIDGKQFGTLTIKQSGTEVTL